MVRHFVRTIDANVKGVANTVQHFVPMMMIRNCAAAGGRRGAFVAM